MTKPQQGYYACAVKLPKGSGELAQTAVELSAAYGCGLRSGVTGLSSVRTRQGTDVTSSSRLISNCLAVVCHSTHCPPTPPPLSSYSYLLSARA
jgi:hypothetical protein